MVILFDQDNPMDEAAYEHMHELGAKQFRRYNQLVRNPRLSPEDLQA